MTTSPDPQPTRGPLAETVRLFGKLGVIGFGGPTAHIAMIEEEAVHRRRWLTREQFLDGVALGQSTPGPIVITAAFVGYAAAGLPGAAVATVAVFLPSFVFATASARFVAAVRRWQLARAFLKGVAAAVAGAILAAAVLLFDTAVVDPLTAVIAAVALLALVWARLDVTYLLAAGAAVGLLAKEAF